MVKVQRTHVPEVVCEISFFSEIFLFKMHHAQYFYDRNKTRSPSARDYKVVRKIANSESQRLIHS